MYRVIHNDRMWLLNVSDTDVVIDESGQGVFTDIFVIDKMNLGKKR